MDETSLANNGAPWNDAAPPEAPARTAAQQPVQPVQPAQVVRKPSRPASKAAPAWLFWAMLASLVALVSLGAAYAISDPFRDALPTALWGLPISVPWLGAIGGTLATLNAIDQHAGQWRITSERVHLARPLVAAVTGVLAAVMLKLLAELGAGGSGAKVDAVTYAVIAFIAGYRDETFRLLVKRATDALLVPGSKPSQTASRSTARTGH